MHLFYGKYFTTKESNPKQNVAICNLYFCHERSKDANN